MKAVRIARITLLVPLAILLFAFVAVSENHRAAAPRPRSVTADKHCKLVGGSIMTNFGAIDQNTTMGTATGDLAGAVSGTLLGAAARGPGTRVVFHIQHHWVTETGDILLFDEATATTQPLSQTLFAVVTYPVHLKGGTGKFTSASGDLNSIGEFDLNSGTVCRYSGEVCFAMPDDN